MTKKTLRHVALSTVLSAMSAGSTSACGEPDDLIVAQMFLNVKFQNASHVSGATWQAQQAGILPMPYREKFTADRERSLMIARQAHEEAVQSQGLMGVNLAYLAREKWDISLVLLETMHWGQFRLDPSRPMSPYDFNCNASNSQSGDLVLVTQAVALHTIVNGQLTVSQALDLGVLRIYGSGQRRKAFVDQFGQLGSAPLQDVSGEKDLLARITFKYRALSPDPLQIGQ